LSSSYANFFIFTACKLDGLKAEAISSCQLSPPNVRLKYVKSRDRIAKLHIRHLRQRTNGIHW
jgi:hypothetical protein